MTSANKSLEKKRISYASRLRLEQLLRIFRALQTSRVLHISMNARERMNQLLIDQNHSPKTTTSILYLAVDLSFADHQYLVHLVVPSL